MTTALQLRPEQQQAELGMVRAEPAPINFGDLLALSKELVKTGFLPDHIKTDGQCAAIILTGRELGMEPMRALRSLQMVKGKVVENADSQLARFKQDGGRAIWKELSDTKAVLWLQHPNGDEHTETFTMADAERAGLTKVSHKGEPSMFAKYPKPMLRSRAITAGMKSLGWEGGVGNYDPAEAAEFAPQVRVTPPTAEAAAVAPGTTNGDGDETGEAPSEKQVQFFTKLLASHVFTDEEREKGRAAMMRATKLQATDLIDRAKAELERRKALEQQEATAEEREEATV